MVVARQQEVRHSKRGQSLVVSWQTRSRGAKLHQWWSAEAFNLFPFIPHLGPTREIYWREENQGRFWCHWGVDSQPQTLVSCSAYDGCGLLEYNLQSWAAARRRCGRTYAYIFKFKSRRWANLTFDPANAGMYVPLKRRLASDCLVLGLRWWSTPASLPLGSSIDQCNKYLFRKSYNRTSGFAFVSCVSALAGSNTSRANLKNLI